MSRLKPVFMVYVHQPRVPQNFIVYIITECPASHSNKSLMYSGYSCPPTMTNHQAIRTFTWCARHSKRFCYPRLYN